MSSVFTKFQQIIDEVKPLLTTYVPDKFADAINSSETKLQERTLSIQLYGSYNAGKSTFVNVLLGQDTAPIGEIPTTDHIDSYDWNGYKLLDSPGVNAPIEHEEVTLEALRKNDLIVFIIRQDDQDAKDIYNRIFDCLLDKKRVFIILNYNGLDPASSGEGSVSLLVSQINKILLTEATNHGVTESQLQQQISVLPVNLKTAYRGQIDNETLLLDYSGYTAFISNFSEWVKFYDDENHFVEAIKNYLQKTLVHPIQDTLKNKSSLADDQQSLARTIHNLEIQRDTLISSSSAQLRMLITDRKSSLFDNLSDIQSAEQANNILETYILTIEHDFNEWFVQQAEQVQQKIHSDISSSADIPSDLKHNDTLDKITSLGFDALKNENSVKSGITEGLKLLRSNKIAFKGIWTKTFEKWANKLGPVVTIIVTIFQAFHAGKKEDKNNEHKKNARLQLHQMINDISNEIKDTINTSVTTLVENTFNSIILEQDKILEQLNNDSSTLEKDLLKIQQLAHKLDSIHIN